MQNFQFTDKKILPYAIHRFRSLFFGCIVACNATTLLAQNAAFKKIDEATKVRLTISGFSLCDTRLSDLKALSDDFAEVAVEEMDLPKTCYGQDSRFTGGKGIHSNKYPGIIFQEGNVEGYVGKIRLTKQFRGKLPNGAVVDLSTMKLRDVFKIYPELKDSWGSRGCSDYWNFSDKTISFYVKIDKSIQPQFPVRDADYMDKPVEGVDLVASCYELLMPSRPIQLFKHDEPMIFLDSIRTNISFITQAYSPDEFASVTVIKDDEAVRLGGDARNGILYIFTKDYLRTKYWNLFREMSAPFAKAVKSPTDADVVYILNDKIVTEKTETELFSITRENLLDIEVIEKKQLKKQFGKKGKVGVILRTRK